MISFLYQSIILQNIEVVPFVAFKLFYKLSIKICTEILYFHNLQLPKVLVEQLYTLSKIIIPKY